MITEPHIEDAAFRADIPVELYYFSELGLEYFSVEEFAKRDPFSNPEQFEKSFARLQIKEWILPTRKAGRYQVSDKARNAVRRIIQAGDEQLAKLPLGAEEEHESLLTHLRQIILANNAAPEPPPKWAVAKRFRIANKDSPLIVKIREGLMDLLAYHDDVHLAAARPFFGEAGIVWNAFGCVWNGSANTAEKIAEALAFRGYEAEDYSAALQAAMEAGWLETAGVPGAYRTTFKGLDMHAQVEKLTDEYFYRPWAAFSPPELTEFQDLLAGLREQLQDANKKLQENAQHGKP